MKKLYTLSFLLIGGLGLNAQIMYTDIPDVVITPTGTATYGVDLNGSTVDFVIGAQGTTANGGTGVQGGSAGNAANRVLAASGGDLKNTPLGTSIAATPPGTDVWDAFGADVPTSVFFGSPFLTEYASPNNIGYIAVTFDISGSTHYGWVQVDVHNTQVQITVLDYAYEATPNTPINAGDKGISTGIAQIENTEMSVYNSNNSIVVKNVESNLTVNVLNLSGQVVKTRTAGKARLPLLQFLLQRQHQRKKCRPKSLLIQKLNFNN